MSAKIGLSIIATELSSKAYVGEDHAKKSEKYETLCNCSGEGMCINVTVSMIMGRTTSVPKSALH